MGYQLGKLPDVSACHLNQAFYKLHCDKAVSYMLIRDRFVLEVSIDSSTV